MALLTIFFFIFTFIIPTLYMNVPRGKLKQFSIIIMQIFIAHFPYTQYSVGSRLFNIFTDVVFTSLMPWSRIWLRSITRSSSTIKHIVHWSKFGLSFLWPRRWTVNEDDATKPASHTSHLNGRSPVWRPMWLRRFFFVRNILSQYGHASCRFWKWHFSCSFK